jgi:hypothetical protein
MSSTSSGSSSGEGMPGMNPSARPPSTSVIGYGTRSTLASEANATMPTSSPKITSSRCSTALE